MDSKALKFRKSNIQTSKRIELLVTVEYLFFARYLRVSGHTSSKGGKKRSNSVLIFILDRSKRILVSFFVAVLLF